MPRGWSRKESRIALAIWVSIPLVAIGYAIATRLIAGPGCGFECYSEDQTYTTTNAIILAAMIVVLWFAISVILFLVWLVREFMKPSPSKKP